ncbi:MAG: dihydrofolate synthase/folylpolyglutamate synthase, partial [Myxococcota bacterium]
QLGGLSVGMAGDFQAINAALALGAARAFLGRDLDPDAAQAALSGVQLPGRAEVVQQHPRVILDGAHNPDKIRGAADTVARTAGRRIAVVALKAGKDAGSILPIVDQHVDHVILTRFRDKGLWTCVPPEEMRAILPHAEVIEDPDEAVSAAIDQAGAADTVWITGSLYLIGDVRQRWFPIAARLAALERDAK